MNADTLYYIPQRPPFVMIGEVISADEVLTKTTFTIPADNLFVVNGHFTEPGLIENMAQTAAAGTGYRAHKDNMPAPIGYIAALKNVQIHALPKAGDTIATEITFQQTLMSFHLVTGRVLAGGNEIANCELKIFVNTDQNPVE